MLAKVFSRIELHVDGKTMLLRRLLMVEQSGDEKEVIFSKLDRNVELNALNSNSEIPTNRKIATYEERNGQVSSHMKQAIFRRCHLAFSNHLLGKSPNPHNLVNAGLMQVRTMGQIPASGSFVRNAALERKWLWELVFMLVICLMERKKKEIQDFLRSLVLAR